jgi:glycosyltransferase involved in cell wall biosynthesis
MKILVLEPYHGASHKRFLDDLAEHLPFEFVRLTQPARAWKWRMRFSAPYFAAELEKLQDQSFDLILASTFLSLSDFRGLAPRPFHDLPVAVYWHENQWAYPVRKEDERDRHYVITNFTSALAADLNLFNSEWNRSSLMAGLGQVLKAIPDTNLMGALAAIEGKSEVLWPPMIGPTSLGEKPDIQANHVPRILWNHRWEHDKNPEEFFQSLFDLMGENIPFELIVAGQSYATQPRIFERAREKLKDRVVHWGFIENEAAYAELLGTADIVVSTARHEFFGLAVMEAALAGSMPLVPNHLSYPEIYPESSLYPPGQLTPHLRKQLLNPSTCRDSLREALAPHLWATQKPKWEKTLRRLSEIRSH